MEEMKDQNRQTIIIQQQPAPSNGLGIAGFVLSLVALFLGWVPVVGWLLWLVGWGEHMFYLDMLSRYIKKF